MEKTVNTNNAHLPIDYWENEFKNGWKNGQKPSIQLLNFLKRYEPGKTALDVGCGDGRHLIIMAMMGYKMTGLELTEHGIATTNKKLEDLDLTAKIIQGDFHHLPFPASSFELIISIQALHYNNWVGAEKSFSEIARVLKSGGYFFFRARSEKSHWRASDEVILDRGITRREYRGPEKFVVIVHDYTLNELQELARNNGLKIIEAYDENCDGQPGQWNVIFQKM